MRSTRLTLPETYPSAAGYANLRLAVVSPFVDRRHGTERALAELLERLAGDYGCEIHLYAQHVEDLHLSGPESARDQEPGAIFWHRTPSIPGPHLVQFLAWMFWNGFLGRWQTTFKGAAYDLVLSPGINCLRPDVVIVHALFHRLQELARSEKEEPGTEAGFLRRAHRRAYYGLLTALERRIYSDPGVTLAAVSERTAGLLKAYFGREDVTVIPNGVDTNEFSGAARLARRAEARQLRNYGLEDFVLLLIGNDWQNKGLPTIFEAMAALPLLPLRLLVVGSDSVEPFRRYAARLGVQDRCRWERPSPEVLDFYAVADVYVSPSREDSFGLPVAEAMACGLPAITSANAGVADYVQDGVDGFVLRNPCDAQTLARLVERLHAEAELRLRVGAAAAKTIQEWDWNRNAAAVWELLQNAKARKPTRG